MQDKLVGLCMRDQGSNQREGGGIWLQGKLDTKRRPWKPSVHPLGQANTSIAPMKMLNERLTRTTGQPSKPSGNHLVLGPPKPRVVGSIPASRTKFND